MTLELEEVVGLISKQPAELIATLKSDDGEWKTKEEVLAAIRKADKDRLDAITKGESGKAVRLRMKKAQDFIREQYGIESDAAELEDHLKLLVDKMGKPGETKTVEKIVDLDEEKALQHPVVKNLLKTEVSKTTAQLQKQLEDKDKEFKAYVEEDKRKKLDAVLMVEAEKILVSSKAALDKDPATKEKQIRRFVSGLKADFRFKLDDSGKPVPVDANGEILQEGYNDVTYADLVKKENIFGVHQYDPDKGSAGASSQQQSKPQRYDGQVPKSDTEYVAALQAEKDPQKRAALRDAYKASLAKPAA